ncbi:MAG TPA: fibronectin type III domain-containing protein, partial [Longimicrobiales bacterium]|nr:fibronectin type III domain-containing protein [Longimicrobiales bacterium]
PHLRTNVREQAFVDRDVANGVRYRYRVRALDLAGRVGGPTPVVEVRPVDDRPPATPVDVVTEEGDGRVRVAWRMALEPDVVGYSVERSTGLDQPYDRVAEGLPVDAPTWTDDSVRGGEQYFYRVVAVDAQGRESRPSNARSAVPYDDTPPAPPAGLRAEAAERRLSVSWEASPSDDVMGYHVYRSDGPGYGIRLTTEPVAGLSYTDEGFEGEGLNPGGRYTIRVAAVDHSFNESELAEVRTQIPDDQPPAAPTALRARSVQGRLVEVSWSTGGSLDVASYQLTRQEAGGARTDVATVAADGTRRVRDQDVRTGTDYTYRLVAVDSAGNRSEPAVQTLSFRRLAPPPSPRRVSAAPAGAGVRVTWERVVDDELVGYRVYRSNIPTGVYEPVSNLVPPGGPLEYVDAAGQGTHYYTVRAVDRSGNESTRAPSATAAESADAGGRR